MDDAYVGRRLRLSRSRGWRLPDRAKSVAHPTRWANPFRPARRGLTANARAVEQYRRHLQEQPLLVSDARLALTGFDLACWCPPDLPCHADVLLEIVARSQTPLEDPGSRPGTGQPHRDDVSRPHPVDINADMPRTHSTKVD